MGSLTKDDLEQINKLFADNFAVIWEQNIEPTMATKQDVAIEGQKTRDYTDRCIAKYSGNSVSRDKGLEGRVKRTGDKLKEKKVFTRHDVEDIQSIPVFHPTTA